MKERLLNPTIKYYYLCTFVILYGLTSCVEEIEIKTPYNSQIVVTGFFTNTVPWNVRIYNTIDLAGNETTQAIVDARVSITSNSGDTIILKHKKNGIYESESFPEVGIVYELNVEIDGYEKILAKSYVPDISKLSDFMVDSTLQTIVTNFSLYSELVSTGFKVSPPIPSGTKCLIRILKFDPEEGYKRYLFNKTNFNHMLQLGVDSSVVSQLKILDNKIIYGPLIDVLWQVIGEIKTSDYIHEIASTTFLDEIDFRANDAFTMQTCISSPGLFYQTAHETYTLLGDLMEEGAVKVYTYPFYEGEYWLEYLDLSAEYYKFQKDYSLQLSNRGNLNAPPVMVYSNIENGTGIFAGYQKQMLQIYPKNISN